LIKIIPNQPEGDYYLPSIAAFFLLLVCTNGMISKTEVSASYRHISLKILEKFPEVLERIFRAWPAKEPVQNFHADPGREPSHDH